MKPKKWLEQPDSIFHLVVDELHSYRGTSGSEVAFLLRTLFNRLGLDPDSPKLRIIASSASLEGNEEREEDEGSEEDEGRKYLRQFFARGKSFNIIGSPPHQEKSDQLRECLKHAKHFEVFNRNGDSTELDKIPKDLIKSAVAQLCYNKGKLHASTVEDMLECCKQSYFNTNYRRNNSGLNSLSNSAKRFKERSSIIAATRTLLFQKL